MYKKNKQATVSDFRLQLNGLQDSPFTRETVSSMELDLCYSDKLVIDFSKEKESRDFSTPLDSPTDLHMWGRPERTDSPDFRLRTSVYIFEEHAHVYFCDLSSTAYHTNNELAILNNRLNLSLLRFDFDFDNLLHHFRNLKKLYHKSSDLYTSTGFFEHRFDNLMISTTLQFKVLIDDYNSNKPLTEVSHSGVTYAKAWDELYGLFDSKGYLSIFDIRDSSYAIKSINCKNGKKDVSNDIRCLDAKKRDNKFLISTNKETFIFDIRKSETAMEGKSPIYSGKRNSLTYLEDKMKEVKVQSSTVNCTKSFFIDNNRAVIMDFVEGTLDLHEFSHFSIQKSIFFGKELYDVGYSESMDKLAVLLENQEGNGEVAIFNTDLTLHNILSLGKTPYTKLGFIGSEGKLLVHSKNDYVVFDVNQKLEPEEI